jgi:putative transposase
MQLMAGRTGQEYNNKKIRNGAFWEDRYHATAIEHGLHLLRCSSYIDFNMIRAGIVSTPCEWETCGYKELLEGKKRYRIIDRETCANEFGYTSIEKFSVAYREHIQQLLNDKYGQKREPEWSEAIAVGSKHFIEGIQQNLQYIKKAWMRRLVTINENTSLLRETEEEYTACNAYIPEFGIISGI